MSYLDIKKISSINEKRLMDSTKLKITPEIIKNDADVVLCVGTRKLVKRKAFEDYISKQFVL